MKTILIAAAATTLAIALNSAAAFAEGPKLSGHNNIFPTSQTQVSGQQLANPHYEWQYHYVGHHPRFEGHWALVN